MARRQYTGFAVDSSGVAISSAQVEVRDTDNNLLTLYAAETGATEAYSGSNPFNAGDGDPDKVGYFTFWVEIPVDMEITVGVGANANTFQVYYSNEGFSDGTASAPSITFVDDDNTGIYRSGTDSLSISTAGTQRVVVSASGNVGIGTSNPGYTLDVNGEIGTSRVNAADSAGAANPAYRFLTDTDTGIFNAAANELGFTTGGAERLRIDSSGRVGIGKSNPQALFHTSSTGEGLVIFEGDSDNDVGEESSIIELRTDAAAVRHQIVAEGATTNTFSIRAGGGLTSASAVSSDLTFFTKPNLQDPQEKARLTSSGNLGIGTSAPDYKLDVNGTFGFTPGSSVTPVDNGDVVFELTNNTTLTIKAKGSDGTVRSGTVTLA